MASKKEEYNKYDDAIDYYLKVVQADTLDNISKMNTLTKVALIYKEEKKDLNNALKYASLASILTFSPRADVCCLISDIYLEMNNPTWAIRWAENAIGNLPQIDETNGFDNKYCMYVPMLQLCNIYYKMEDFEKAAEYNAAVLKVYPENEDALYNKKMLEKVMVKN